jgi:hypothetical protein
MLRVETIHPGVIARVESHQEVRVRVVGDRGQRCGEPDRAQLGRSANGGRLGE